MTSDIWTWIVYFAVAGGFLYIGFRMVQARLDRLRAEEELAEMEFQRTVMAGLGQDLALGEDDRFLIKPDAVNARQSHELENATTPQEDAASTLHAATPASSNIPASPASLITGEHVAADVAAAGVMSQLSAINLVSGVDGYVALHGNPKGAALLRLRTGKQALLVPHMESEAFLRHNARRADLIIMIGTDGKAVVVTPLEQFLAESFPTG